ncbi:MAG: aspartate/glutamate racemase family protein [Candidatus Acidiferrales bacterium]|jgi:Asp/Glu/hydantoin racemase
MPETLTLIHTSPVLTPVFASLCKQHLPDVAIFRMVDESLIRDTIAHQKLRKLTVRRLISMIDSAQAAGATAVMVTCSSIGPAAALAQKLFDIPVFRVDDAMAEKAVGAGRRIGVLATLSTTLEPTLALLSEKAADAGRPIELLEVLCANAFDAVLAGDIETHDRIVSEALLQLASKVDVIVLAQASMARVLSTMPRGSIPVPVLSSPELAVLQVRDVLRMRAQSHGKDVD